MCGARIWDGTGWAVLSWQLSWNCGQVLGKVEVIQKLDWAGCPRCLTHTTASRCWWFGW